jgi:hypothetical protein
MLCQPDAVGRRFSIKAECVAIRIKEKVKINSCGALSTFFDSNSFIIFNFYRCLKGQH